MPNRLIKDSIRTSKSVNAMSDFQFRLWVYLITYVDDYGRGSADPELLKGFVFPRRKGVTEVTIQKTLADLAATGSVILYEVDGEPYLCFPNWSKHQTVRNRVSKYPAPEDGEITVESNCKQLKSIESNCKQLKSIESNCSRNPIQNPNPESESNTPLTPHGGADGDIPPEKETPFDRFWAAYPKKVGKQAAKKAFGRVKVPVETLVSAIEQQKCSRQWTRDNGDYIPNPTTWLNQGRWDDELKTEMPADSGGYHYDYGDMEDDSL